jgi:hypothetical protein
MLTLPAELSAGTQLLLFFAAVLLIIARCPAYVLHAQFYAEDGKRWFAQAYNQGWLHSLAIPDASYLQVLPRLVAGVALLLPFRDAPLVMDLGGILVQALPVAALLNRRCSPWGPLPVRLALAAVYLLIPNASEIHVNLTNAQWHYALLEVLLAFGLAPRTWLGRVLDIFIFVLGIFSGPFGIVLLPLLLVLWWYRRQRWTLVLAACLTFGAAIQVHSILTGTRNAPLPLGATPLSFLRLLGGDIFLDGMIGNSTFVHKAAVLLVLLSLFGLAVILCANLWGPLSFRLMTAFAAVLLAGALKSPMIAGPRPLWQALMDDPGARYWFFPTLVFLWAAVYCLACVPLRPARLAGCAVLLLFLAGAARKFEYKPLADHHFDVYVQKFEATPPGQHVLIPIHPDWTMDLLKH